MKRAMRATGLVIGLAATMASIMPLPAQAQAQAQVQAQAQGSDVRLERIETQLRALQRQVFPGGDQRFFEPEITAQQPTQPRPNFDGSTSTLTDVLARLDALGAQLARLTAATEVNGNAMTGLETRLAALEAGGAAVASAGATIGAAPAITTPATPPRPTGVIAVPGTNQSPTIAPPAALPAVATGPSPDRLAGVQAIAKPATSDAGQDDYVYGFRLWEAGFYPEAQQQLAMFVDRHPRHASMSRGRNLLGRAFLDGGEPRQAATHFFDNYRADPQGDRAPDSLLYLAESMVALNDTDRACRALAEFSEIYPGLALGRLQGQYDGLFRRVTCN